MKIETIDQFYRKYEELDRLYRHKSPGALYHLFQDVITPLQQEIDRLKGQIEEYKKNLCVCERYVGGITELDKTKANYADLTAASLKLGAQYAELYHTHDLNARILDVLGEFLTEEQITELEQDDFVERIINIIDYEIESCVHYYKQADIMRKQDFLKLLKENADIKDAMAIALSTIEALRSGALIENLDNVLDSLRPFDYSKYLH